MQYRFEIVSSPDSKVEVCEGCMFEDELLDPILHLNDRAKYHFSRLGRAGLGDRLDLVRYLINDPAPAEGELFCSAAFILVGNVPTVRMIAGPLIKRANDAHA
ncbi:MAG: hypothetical protein REJ23_00475 [Brevundimonas sp.]|nr:hypothetical protein [Brevundimonas sp.]